MGNFKYPIDVAKRDVARWRQTCKINGFAVKKAELREIMDSSDMEDMTCYFGLDETGAMKMFLVADSSIKPIDTTGLRDNSDEYVYDFTNPCPPTCDPNSPLN